MSQLYWALCLLTASKFDIDGSSGIDYLFGNRLTKRRAKGRSAVPNDALRRCVRETSSRRQLQEWNGNVCAKGYGSIQMQGTKQWATRFVGNATDRTSPSILPIFKNKSSLVLAPSSVEGILVRWSASHRELGRLTVPAFLLRGEHFTMTGHLLGQVSELDG